MPDLDTLVDDAKADRFTEKWIAKLAGKKASAADYAIHVECGGLRFQFDALITHAFERIAKLEGELRKAKGLMTKSAGPAAVAFEIEQGEDGRTFTFKSATGDQSFEIPVPIFRGAWKEGETYAHGDTVVWGGSSWSALRRTCDRPDTPDSGWMIAARKGRDGKDSRPPA
ncbi:hypothetical protein CDQ91_14415 [Sphingopyxis witflariensis]|uniref:Uncharacterized protein n=1 Tax=Sphingopyxis witflariensis TaxID=173675 RepID=A0A2D0AMX2_9SPHN|nr:hypothetical protein CDQ91_14415 [Sphingopyxis witflariensis]